MACRTSSECSCEIIQRFRCKCDVDTTELNECSEVAKNDLIETCLHHLKATENSIFEYPKILSASVKTIFKNHSDILFENHRFKVSDQLQHLESIKIQTKEITRRSMEELKDLEITQKAIKSFLKFLHEKNERNTNKMILTKFSKLTNNRSGFKKITIPPKIQVSRDSMCFSKPRAQNDAVSRVNRISADVASIDYSLLKSLSLDGKFDKDLFFCFIEPNIVSCLNVSNNLKQKLTLNHNCATISLIYNQGDKYVYYFYGKSQLPNTSNAALRIDAKTKTIVKLTDSYFSKFGSSVPVAHLTKLYFFGGFSKSNQLSADSEYFDMLTETWTVISPMPAPSSFASGVEINNEIYLTSNELRSVNKYYPKTDQYQTFFDSISGYLQNFHMFLAAAGEKLFYFYNRGIYRIDQPGNHEFFGSLGIFANLGIMIQYLVRNDKIFFLMSTGRVIEFYLNKGRNPQAKIIDILTN